MLKMIFQKHTQINYTTEIILKMTYLISQYENLDTNVNDFRIKFVDEILVNIDMNLSCVWQS